MRLNAAPYSKNNILLSYVRGTKGDHNLILLNDGTVRSIGANQYGQLGIGYINGQTKTGSESTWQVLGLTNIIDIAAGHQFSLALDSSGRVYAWGNNKNGQIGNGSTYTFFSTPQLVSNIRDISSISAGYHHALALSNDGTAYGWGNAANGALGEIGQDACYSPVTIDIDDVEKVIAGMDNSFFIKNDKTVYACGNNDYGQLGDGTLNSRKSISAVEITDVSDISAGFSTLFLKTDGSAYGCGLNAFGELGIGNTTANVRNITKIPGSYDEVSTGGHHSLFLGKDKYIYAAGRNHRKQCGTSDTAKNYLSPTEILAFEDDLLIYDYLSQEKELNITSGNLYVFAVTVGNMIDIQNKIFTVSYDNTKLDVDDICAQTWKKDTSIGNVADTDITILSKTDSQVQFKVNNAKSTSGTVNLIRFKAISTGTASITVEVK